MKKTLVITLSSIALAGCVTERAPAAATHNFICDQGASVAIAFSGSNATLITAGASAALTQQPSGSGFRYSGGGHEVRGKGYELTWTRPDGARLACREEKRAMHGAQHRSSGPPLAGSKWRLVYFQSMDDAVGTKVPPSIERYQIEFMADGSAALRLDCNRARATWAATSSSARGGALELNGGAMTRAACQAGAMDAQIVRDLPRVRSYTMEGNRLGLALEADGGVYVWERQD